MGILSFTVDNLFRLITLLIVIVVLMSWIPNINWYKQPFKFLRFTSDLFLSPFRRLIPPMGGLDFSPIIAIFLYQLLGQAIVVSLKYFGL